MSPCVQETTESASSVIDTALARDKKWRDQEAQEEAEGRDFHFRRYQELLLSDISGTPISGQETLADHADHLASLGITAERAADDRELLVRALELQEHHDDLQVANTRQRETREAYKALEQRHKAEEREAWMVQRRAAGYASTCAEASYALVKLARQRPEFFDGNAVPRLRSPGASLLRKRSETRSVEITEELKKLATHRTQIMHHPPAHTRAQLALIAEGKPCQSTENETPDRLHPTDLKRIVLRLNGELAKCEHELKDINTREAELNGEREQLPTLAEMESGATA